MDSRYTLSDSPLHIPSQSNSDSSWTVPGLPLYDTTAIVRLSVCNFDSTHIEQEYTVPGW